VTVWNLDSLKEGEEPRPFKSLHGVHTDSVTALAFSPDGRRLYSSGADVSVRVWDAGAGTEVRLISLPGPGGAFRLTLSPDGTRLAAAVTSAVHVFDADSGRPQGVRHLPQGATLVAFSPDGNEVATANTEGFRVWSATTGGLTRRVVGQRTAPTALAFTPDGWLCLGREDRSVRLLDLRYGSRQIELPSQQAWTTAPMAFSPDGRLAASADRVEDVYLWDLERARLLTTLRGHDQGVRRLAFSSDGKRLLSGGDDGTARVWEVPSGKQLIDLGGQTREVLAVAFDPAGRWLATTCRDRSVRLYDSKSGKAHHVFAAAQPAEDLCFSPTGDALAVANGSSVHVLDPVTGKVRYALSGHADAVRQVRFSPDGSTAATASADRTVRLWDLKSAAKTARVLKGHTAGVLAVAFTPDGKRLASAGGDRTVRVWDVQLGAEVLALKDHAGVASSLTFSRDGRRLLAGADGKDRVHVWEVPGK
jgi:WD40 repeat protein